MSDKNNKLKRKLPQWMQKRAAVGNAIKNIIQINTNENKNFTNNLEPPIRRLRSNAPKSPEDSKPEKPDIEDLPMVDYDGKIHYLNDFISIAETLDSLIKKIDSMPDGDVPVAFDMEWTFSFKTGPEKASLIQVCIDLDECFLIHIPQLKKLPATLSAFLGHPRVRLHGVNIKNDLRKLERDYPIIKTDKMIERCIDLGPMYNDVCGSSGRWSMERLVLQTLRLRVDKSRHVRMSKWHIVPLNENQMKYAAIDVYIAQKVYYFIKSKEKEVAEDIQGVFQVFGEEEGFTEDQKLPNKESLSSEIDKLMQNNI